MAAVIFSFKKKPRVKENGKNWKSNSFIEIRHNSV